MAKLPDGSGDVYSNIVSGDGTEALTFTMPKDVALDVSSVVATIANGSAAAVTPEIVIKDATGVVIATNTQTRAIPGGDTGTATFARRLIVSDLGTLVGGGGQPGLIEEVDLAADVTITATTQGTATSLLTGTSHVYDGATTIKFELSALVQIDMRGNPVASSGGFALFDLWEDGAVVKNIFDLSVSGILLVTTAVRTFYFTPTAGAHTYSVRGWKGHGAGVADPGASILANAVSGTASFTSFYSLTQVNPLPA